MSFYDTTVNSYLGTLFITMVGAFATLLILHVANAGTFAGFDPVSDIAGAYTGY